MDMSMMMDKVSDWIEQQYGGKQTMSKDELAMRARNSDLPQEAKGTFDQLPQGDYTKSDLKSRLGDMMKSGAGMMGGGGGGGGGMGGGMGGMRR